MSSNASLILWSGPSPVDGSPIVAVATMASANRKTGDMVQVWIMPRNVAPHDSIRTGADAAVCGSCPLRGDGTGKGRACYVNVSHAPLSVWRAMHRGAYRDVSSRSLDYVAGIFAGRRVRLGAWGDPAMLPLPLVEAITSRAAGWTGYTHQWRYIDPAWSGYVMASADTVEDRRDARAMGYRSFYVVPKGHDTGGIPGAMECAATRERNPLQCAECLACAGTRRGTVAHAVDVVVSAHGAGAKYIGRGE